LVRFFQKPPWYPLESLFPAHQSNTMPPLLFKAPLTPIPPQTLNNKEPHNLFSILQETFYSTRRRPQNGNFYDNSNGKIGKQKLDCKLKCMNCIKFDRLEVDFNDNRLRMLLMDTFFSYQLPNKVWQHRIYHKFG